MWVGWLSRTDFDYGLAKRSNGCYGCKWLHTAMNPIYRITYQRPWGQCVVNTAQFATEAELRTRFANSYKGCEIILIEDVTKEFFNE
jgi:hypothetical protein